jgi:glyoxylate/hydroxypyruvate reductase A
LIGRLPRLKAVMSLGAGVEQLLADPELPPALPVGRVIGPRLAADMAAYVVGQVLHHRLDLDRYRALQRQQRWASRVHKRPARIGLLGAGRIASAVAQAFQSMALPVEAWARTERRSNGLRVRAGDAGLAKLLRKSDYVVCLLPLTEATRGILDQSLFRHMKRGSVLINVGRGAHLQEPDLLPALEDLRPALAILDVFAAEPLPAGHPFWTHPAIRITPHCAAVTAVDEAAALIVESYRRVNSGQAPLGLVSRSSGY